MDSTLSAIIQESFTIDFHKSMKVLPLCKTLNQRVLFNIKISKKTINLKKDMDLHYSISLKQFK